MIGRDRCYCGKFMPSVGEQEVPYQFCSQRCRVKYVEVAKMPLPSECPSCGEELIFAADCLGFGHANLELNV